MKIHTLTHACAALQPAKFPNTPWTEIAVSGRSNVGKSSLLNCLLGRKNFARISREPGKTRTVNFYLVNDRFYMVDLPGYGYAKVSAEVRKQWRRLIYGYIDTRKALGGVVQLVDARHPPTQDDRELLQRLVDSGRPFIVALTKADKISRSERRRVFAGFSSCFEGIPVIRYGTETGARERPHGQGTVGRSGAGNGSGHPAVPVLFFSAKTREGRDGLWRWISERLA
ncbi:MAG: YihA family ribosome biogenesis GTP-binding protein [bacterium]|nr:MAG: YihA family ribosome biogenesis GTP-binding protein [bacterium]